MTKTKDAPAPARGTKPRRRLARAIRQLRGNGREARRAMIDPDKAECGNGNRSVERCPLWREALCFCTDEALQGRRSTN